MRLAKSTSSAFAECSLRSASLVKQLTQRFKALVVQDLIQAETVKGGRKRGRDSAAFLRWFTQANTFPPGLIDTLADIIKDQLWVNPLEFMDAEEDAEVQAPTLLAAVLLHHLHAVCLTPCT